MINNFAYVSLMDFVLHFFVVVAAPVAIFTNSGFILLLQKLKTCLA